jgi:hypothetical protein
MPNLSHLVIIEDVIVDNHILQDRISTYGKDLPEDILSAAAILDHSMRQFGRYWEIREVLIREGEITNA